ncbi:hypothetical protein J31TS4_03140 [Paenibacillus sp. J31TS4]|uniref:extracellular solute-binding protein n=1 Tax=Paenibacillus sp. J31TS4 TaxID=2807195 RepID=UPI001B03487F|nr:extracellular solute-binding protein [Paenibacillus sp. J31TS4]GIP37034.1 hypothetical protein J31TS4_03140 [Paenibacillus sp. J31TS4]
MSNKPDRMTFQVRFDEMINTLRREIIRCERPPGSYLPSELSLADHYKLSKKSVRKGLDLLVEEGLISKVPRVGNRVRTPDKQEAVEITVGCYPSVEGEAQFSELIGRFHRQYPHIKVETVSVPYTDYPDSIKHYLENGWLDVITLNGWNFQEIVENDAHDLFEPLTASGETYPYLQQVFKHEGKLYVQPLIFSPVILCYNKTLFREMGILEPDSSWSWEQLLDTAGHIKQHRDILGFYAHIASTNRFTIPLLQRNYRFAGERLNSYEDPALWDCLGKFRDLIYEQGLFPAFLSENDADAEKLFAQQKAAVIMTTYFGLKHLRQVDFEYDLAPLPYEHQAKTMLLVTGLALSRFSDSNKKEAAKLFLEFMNSEAAQLYIRQNTLSIPAHKASGEWTGSESIYRPSRYHLYREIAPTFGTYKDLGLPIRELSRLRSELKLFWANLEQPDSVVERLRQPVGSVPAD